MSTHDAPAPSWLRRVRGARAAAAVFLRGLVCGRQAGAYVVFGGGQGGKGGKVLGPQLRLFNDTNDLLVQTLFSKSGTLPARRPSQLGGDDTSGEDTARESAASSFQQVRPAFNQGGKPYR
jgi:hypothetical protein